MINWEEIWEIHSPFFKNGYGIVPLSSELSFRLKPGPVLDLMKPLIKGKTVVDIGCGSGILSIAAKLLGAKEVYAFEIDPDAINHAEENFKINNLKIFLNKKPPSLDLILINMISSEQRIALEQYPFIKQFPHTLLSSGLLVEEKERYLKEMHEWRVVRTKSKKNWLSAELLFN